MNKAQIAVLGVAIVAGGGAFMMLSTEPTPPQPMHLVAPPPPRTTDQVLVAARDLPFGAALAEADTSWIEWPISAVPPGVLRKSEAPEIKKDIEGAFVRTPLANGEPIRRERLIKGQTPGLMSTMISAGRRAVAIDVSPNTTAGGFILPNDHVDVIRLYRDPDQGGQIGSDMNSEVILRNVRVLAMGPVFQTKNGESSVTGATATLDLEPRQAELVILAQRSGQLALMLRPIADALADEKPESAAPGQDPLTIVRFGVTSTMRAR
ncbi:MULTISPECIES: Flp pilus assembly protein CpaB [Methylosinus]|uniref:Flp pilus assembly protein CpaB n=1 Tax=Methylosinus trichosporium (strain ATCC 35070 / NCIMB 11131 / UNIQEM 75 / OB3b) TaxID=595536 RepID=A0A2D2D372_METT3|nr:MULTISPECIES: Flp pilus assembly protein CpaB [Methylosinus]ATQ69452.1 Flp pilus assembly protein CpaB [Methylosinus trichosporium OB3b]OBS52963.1 Flp pilus assembly protein CpaB [Methylosinus sp. 3S-1]